MQILPCILVYTRVIYSIHHTAYLTYSYTYAPTYSYTHINVYIAIMFIVPAIMNLSNSKKPTVGPHGVTLGRIGQTERIFNYVMMLSGVGMGVLGVAISTLRQFGKL